MEYNKLTVQEEKGFIVVALNNPPVNALSQATLIELNRLLDEQLDNDGVRAIVLTSSGDRLFSAGADITEFAGYQAGEQRQIKGTDVFSKIENYPKPVIAALQASAFGGGLELAMSCHLRIVAAQAKLGLPEVKLGIIPGWGGTQRLPRLIGKTKALEIALTGEPLRAEEALHFGLVNKVVAPEEVLSEAKKMAAGFAQAAPLAMAQILKAVTQGLNTTLEQGLEIEAAGSQVVFASEDAKEGSRAFMEKRKPEYKGR